MITSLLKNKKTRIIAFAVALSLAGFIIIYKISANTKQKDTETQKSIAVQAKKGTIRETVSASGQIETANYLTITTSVNGIVNKVYVKEGDVVTKGQAIMDITLNSEGEESLSSARSSYLSARNTLDSAINTLLTYESTLISAEEDFEDEKESNSYQTHDERISYALAENAAEIAQNNYTNQQGTIAQKRTALNKAWLTYQAQSPTIVAPDNGTIANIVMVEGMDITNSLSERTSSTVASIRKEGTPIASLNISEIDINKIKVGQRVEITLNSIEKKTFLGDVVGIDKIGTVSSGVPNYPVIVKFDEDSRNVLPNMGIDAEIIIQEKENVVYVPSPAIVQMKGETMVKVQEGDDGELINVETGITTNEYTEILSGIEEGAEVLINTLPISGFTTSDDETGQGGSSRGVFPGMGTGRK